MSRALVFGAVALGAIGAGALLRVAMTRGTPATGLPQHASHALTVTFSGEDLGQLEPCGCTPAMLGGLARRPARLAASAEPSVPSVFVSGGMLIAGEAEYDRLRLGVVLSALGRMKCVAFAPSRRELAVGVVALARAADEAGVPLVAANVDAPDARPGLFRRYVPLPARGASAYVTGLCATGATIEGAIVTDPAIALRRLRSQLPRGAALVVLAELSREDALSLASADAGPIVVLHTGVRTDPFDTDVQNGTAAVAPLPAKGKFVGLARLAASEEGGAWDVEYRPVLSELPEDDAVKDMKIAHLQALLASDVVRAHSGDARFAVGAMPANDDRYAGSDACADCHAEDTRVWAASRHATAIETLRKTGDDADPDCVRCHVVGYGTGRGFAGPDAASSLGSVGCESCHGPRARHVEDRRAGRADARVPAATERSCLPCHDGEHDPQFDYAPYWARIAHGTR